MRSVRHGGDKKSLQNFGRKPQGKTPRGMHKRKCDDNIKIDLTGLRVWTVSKWFSIGFTAGLLWTCKNSKSHKM